MMLFCLLFLFWDSRGQLYDTTLFTLGTNILTNARFSEPNLAGNVDSNYGTTISGWGCTWNCELVNVPLICSRRGLSCPNDFTQIIDLDNSRRFETVYQTVQLYSAA